MVISNITKHNLNYVFPCLMEAIIDNKRVVFLMSDIDEGSVIYSEHEYYVIGDFACELNIENFNIFNDTIELSNE